MFSSLYVYLAAGILVLLAAASDGQSDCVQQITCKDCISNSSCVWCSDEFYNFSVRCFVRDRVTYTCQNIEDPQSRIDSEEGVLAEGNLVSPRQINITLRPGIPTNFNITVQSARNFPLDLYILIDLSGSLSDDIETLRILSFEITASLSNISSNYRIGLGTFVDKPILPYSLSGNLYTIFGMQCLNNIGECVAPHSYRHVLSLTDDEEDFNEALNSRVNISYGADVAEAGFDSLLQAVVCRNIVGWRDSATHIIVYISDAPTHLAGDGKLAGIVRPNPGICQLESIDGDIYEYMSYRTYDYASLGQVETSLRDTDTSVILAVTSTFQGYYQDLTNDSRRMFLSELTLNSSNIIRIIETQYEILLGTIGLEPVPFAGLSVTAVPIEGCNTTGPNNECTSVPIEGIVVFNVTAVADRCVNNGESFEILIRGFGNVRVIVDPLCNCECEEEAVVNYDKCGNGTGDSVCGVCVCDDQDDRFECPISTLSTEQCSGRGLCDSCGECKCEPQYFGSACECDTVSCEVDANGRICGGNGLCCDGSCVCTGSFTGPLCSCTTDISTCLNSRNEICSNHGECECGACSCTSEYGGDLCDNCIRETCLPCNLYNNCVMCHLNFTNSDCSNCSQIMISIGDVSETGNFEACTVPSGGCSYRYLIRQDTLSGQFIVVTSTSPTSCAVNDVSLGLIFGIAIGLPLLIIIIGLIILVLIKLILLWKEREEVKKFNLELEDTNWGGNTNNPLYVSPAKEYTNVAYKKRGSIKK